MAEVRLRVELEKFKAQIARLKQRMFPEVPTVRKDFSLIFFVPKWSGAETSVPLEEFLSSIYRASRIGHWDEADRLQVAILRLADPAKAFYIPYVHSSTLKKRNSRSSRTRSRMI